MTTGGWPCLRFICDTHRQCNTDHPASLEPTLLLLVKYFRIPVFPRSFNHLKTFNILLEGMVNDGKFHCPNICTPPMQISYLPLWATDTFRSQLEL